MKQNKITMQKEKNADIFENISGFSSRELLFF